LRQAFGGCKRPLREQAGMPGSAGLACGFVTLPTRAVIFDLDGTLLDTEVLYTEAAQELCARYGAAYTLELKRRTMGGDAMTGAQIVAEALGLPIGAAEYLAERERLLQAMWPAAQPMPGAHALLRQLVARAIGIAIATSGHHPITRSKLGHQPFLSDLPLVICGDDPRIARGKPEPDIFLLAASELGTPPAACAAIEDSPNGVRAAVAAGMRTIALIDPRWGYASEAFAGATHRVASLEELTLEMLGIEHERE
jgi:HAD superfamily hydrolase (TIGR01509 family)